MSQFGYSQQGGGQGYDGSPFGQSSGGPDGGQGQQYGQPFGQSPAHDGQPFGQSQPYGGQPFGSSTPQANPYSQPAGQYSGAPFGGGAPQQGYGNGHADRSGGATPPRTPSLEFQTQGPGVGMSMGGADLGGLAAGLATAAFAGDQGAAQRMVEQRARSAAAAWLPGAAAGWARARVYFAVSHASVLSKLRAVLFPWTKRHWRRKRAEELGSEGEYHGHALPAHDANAPDMYVPVVAFVTFALVAGYARGVAGEFSPDALASIFAWCAGLQCLETTLYSVGLWALGARGVPLLDVLSYTGYKYVAMCINALAMLCFGARAYYISLAYTALAAVYFTVKTLAQAVPAELENPQARRELVVLGFGLVQGFSIWLLGKAG